MFACVVVSVATRLCVAFYVFLSSVSSCFCVLFMCVLMCLCFDGLSVFLCFTGLPQSSSWSHHSSFACVPESVCWSISVSFLTCLWLCCIHLSVILRVSQLPCAGLLCKLQSQEGLHLSFGSIFHSFSLCIFHVSLSFPSENLLP